MIENFHYAPFTLGPISSINMEEAGLALRQAGLTQVGHMGPEDPSNRKKYPSFFLKPNFQKLQDDSKNVSF